MDNIDVGVDNFLRNDEVNKLKTLLDGRDDELDQKQKIIEELNKGFKELESSYD